VLTSSDTRLTPEQAEATLEYFVSCGDRLTQMTKTYHDVEAVTRLLEEKEKDLELAAKIGQELLQRNKESDEKVNKLETDLCSANDLITQLRHELQVKTDLLHVYTNDVEDASPLELRSFNVELLQKKINDLEEENKNLHEEASKLAHEAVKCEEKEEKLVKDAVQHLTQANIQIKDLHHQFTHKVDESSRQREEINGLLSQVCDLQKRVQKYSHENDDLTANLRVYQETQDELTSELLDLKEKYREVLDLLRDANEEIRRGRKKTYPGVGKHSVSGMFSQTQKEDGASLQTELTHSLKPARAESNLDSEISDTDTSDLTSAMGSSAYRKAARTFRAIANSSKGSSKGSRQHLPHGSGSADTSHAAGESVFQSYTISRENSFSPDESDIEQYYARHGVKPRDDPEISDDSGTGRSTGLSGLGSLSSSAPREEVARVMLKQATKNSYKSSQASINTSSNVMSSNSHFLVSSSQHGVTTITQSSPSDKRANHDDVEVVEVQTVGQLKAPTFQLSSTMLQSTPLGQVPGQPRHRSVPATPGDQDRDHFNDFASGTQTPGKGHPGLGLIPGKSISALKLPEFVHRASSDFDETEPLEPLTMTRGHHANSQDETQSLSNQPLTYATGAAGAYDFDETEPVGTLTMSSIRATSGLGHPGLGSISGGHPSFGSAVGHPGLGYVPGDGLGSLGSVPSLGENFYQGDVDTWSQDDFSFDEDFNMIQDIPDQRVSINKGEKSKYSDSGVISGDYSDDPSFRRNVDHLDIDALSDGGFTDMAAYPGIRLPAVAERMTSDPLSVELESTLKHLNPAEVERRRKLMGRDFSYDLGREGMDSPGAIAGCEEYFKNLPYGVEGLSEPSSSDSFMKSRISSSLSFRNRRLPDKLRIVKPLEGSLTLHNWSRLATPHLGGVLEERCGVAIKGNDKAGLDPLFDMYRLDEEVEEDDDPVIAGGAQPTNTNFTFTNSTVLHPDTTNLTSFYSRTQMSSGLPSRNQSRMSSRCSSMTDLSGAFPSAYLSNIGLVKLISEKKISCARRSQLDLSSMGSISSLTPSVLNSPYGSKKISPTCTPPHTPEESLPGSPDDKTGDSGYVASFFSSLKAAIYGQQRREHRSTKFKRKMEEKRNNLGIMEAVEEVGYENASTEKEGTPMSLPPLSTVGEKKPSKKSSSGPSQLSDFDVRYLGVLDDYDELEEITPGLLTLTQSTDEPRDPEEYTKQWIGQLSVPSFSATGRPSLQKKEFGKIPQADHSLVPPSALCSFGGRGPGRIVSPGELRPNQAPGLGVPGHPGTGAVGQALGAKRKDLGTIPGVHENDGLMMDTLDPASAGLTKSESFIGSITNMFFSRKGGY